MVSVRDNRATNNNVITPTPQQNVAQCHLNYKATKGLVILLHCSLLLSLVCRLLLLLLGRLSCSSRPPPKKILHFVVTFAIFMPPRFRNSVASLCERGIRKCATADLNSSVISVDNCLGCSNVDRNSSPFKYGVMCCA